MFPLLDQHFIQLVPTHLYERFRDHVLSALGVAQHFNSTAKQLMQYIFLFFPKSTRRFRAQRYDDRVLMPTINYLNKCTALEELYLEKADSAAISTYLLAHILKFTNNLRILSLPKQCDDDVASIVGINCPRLESLIVTGTHVTNVGLSWLLCCRNLHTVVMKGFFHGVTPKGVALLLNGIPALRHVVYDVMSDVLTFVDFNTSDHVLPRFALKTVLFQPMELLSSNHLELVTKLCPDVEWLSLDSALFYDLEGLGLLPNLNLLRLNYKSRPIDQTVVNFFSLNAHNLTTLHLFAVVDLTPEDLQLTVGQCVKLENLVLKDCSVLPWDRQYRLSSSSSSAAQRKKPLSRTVEHLQLVGLSIAPAQLVDFLSLFRDLRVIEMDHCELDPNQIKLVMLNQEQLHTFRCFSWSHGDASQPDVGAGAGCKLQTGRNAFLQEASDAAAETKTMAARLLSDYAGFSPLLQVESFTP